MNWDAVGAIGEAIGAIAVLATLIYLAIQLRQARRQLADQLDTKFISTIFGAYAPIYEGDNARVFHAGLTAPETQAPHEAYVFDLLMWRHGSAVRVLEQQHADGFLDDVELAQYVNHYRHTIFGYPGARAWVARHADRLVPGSIYARLCPEAFAE